MKVALVQDWFMVNGGAEKVVREILSLYPDASVFSLFDFLSDSDRQFILRGKQVTTTFLQHAPLVKKYYRNYLPLFPIAIEQLDFTGFDLIISSSYSVAKGIRKTGNQIHICYCHTPVRYAWDLKEDYLNSMSWPVRLIARPAFEYLQKWDGRTTERVDLFIANSRNVAERIRRIYNRDSVIVYPPVDTSAFSPYENKSDYYFTTLRMVPYKKLDLIINTFNALPDKKLIVSGDGPELNKLKQMAGKNITFMGFLPDRVLITYMQKAKAFVLAAEEDFGITSVEAQSCCTPVIAYRKGGYLETVKEGITGVFFDQQTVESLTGAIIAFENRKEPFKKEDFLNNVKSFTAENFRQEFKKHVADYVAGKSQQS